MYSQLRIVIPNAACNLACKYCVIGNDQEHNHYNHTVVFQEGILKQAIDDDFTRISIWGGEPLANKEAFLQIVQFCKKYYPNKLLGISTNGYLINQWWVDFFNENNIDITISHDGPGQIYRQNYDMLLNEDYISIINKIKPGLSFHSVIHHDNCNIESIVQYFEKLQNKISRPFGWHFGHFKASNPRLIKYIPHGYKLAQLQKSYRWLLQEISNSRPLVISAIGNMVVNLAQKYEQNTFSGFQCSAQRWLTLDTTGTRYFCQVACENKNPHWPENKIPRMCSNCSYLNICTGICPHIPDRYRKKLCIIYKLWFYEVDRFFATQLVQERKKQDALLISH